MVDGEKEWGWDNLDDGIDGACFLAETTEDALGHVNVVARCPPRPVRPRLSFDRYRLHSCASSFASFWKRNTLAWTDSESLVGIP